MSKKTMGEGANESQRLRAHIPKYSRSITPFERGYAEARSKMSCVTRRQVLEKFPEFSDSDAIAYLNGVEDGVKGDSFRLRIILAQKTEELQEVIRLMVYAPLTERLSLAERHAGPFDLIEAKLPKDARLPEHGFQRA